MKALNPLAEKGNSVWSNACGWHIGLLRDETYANEAFKTVDGSMTIQQAVEDYVFKGKKFVNIDKYSWPYHRECAFFA